MAPLTNQSEQFKLEPDSSRPPLRAPAPVAGKPEESTKRVLIVSHDVVGRQMAGPGIRYFHMARVLARHTHVTLAAYHSPDQDPAQLTHQLQPELPGVALATFSQDSWATVGVLAEGMDVVILPSDVAAIVPALGRLPAALVIDGYNPLLAEWLMTHQGAGEDQLAQWRSRMHHLGQQMVVGDLFLCANERQRDWWLGQLEAHGRINPLTMAGDPGLNKLVVVASYGVPSTKPVWDHSVVRALWPQIGPERRMILWGGGLWPWLDPQTAIRAVAALRPSRPDICLIFPGTVHPNPDVAHVPDGVKAAKALAAELGILDEAVFFGRWVDYAAWPSLLLECDAALSLHFDTLETRLAFRSRVLEYLWAGLPVVASVGDATGELAADYGLGVTVPVGDVAGVAGAILTCLDMAETDRSQAAARVGQELSWEWALDPLVHFCLNPKRAADRPFDQAQPGNPFYLDQIHHWQVEMERERSVRRLLVQDLGEVLAEKDATQRQVAAYEQGRFMRLMRLIHGLRTMAGSLRRDRP